MKLDYKPVKALPPVFDFDDVAILKKVNTANIALAKLNGLIASVPNASILLLPLTVREAVASSGIENIFTTTLEVFEAELLGTTNIPTAQKETLYYKDALIYGFDLVKEKGLLTTNQIIAIHAVLEPNKKGIRKLPGTAIVNAGTKEVIHTPPQHEQDIRDLLKNLDEYINIPKADGTDPLIKMAVHHYQFETIHPFYDGNGRTGRILMVLYLVLVERLTYPILFLSGFIINNKRRYYEFLQNVREKGDWKSWVLYVLEGVEEQAKQTCKTIEAILKLINEYRKVKRLELSFFYSTDLVLGLFSSPFHTHQSFKEIMKIHHNTAVKYLSELEKNNLVKSKVLKKKKVYFIPEFVEMLR